MFETHFSKFILISGLFVGGVILNACSTLSKEECLAADWIVIGEADGAAGYEPQDRFGGHIKSCSKAGITPDQTLWSQGYQKGLVRYCTPLNGLRVGEAGKTYHNVCPLDKDAAFTQTYRLGKKAYDLRSQISSKRSAITNRQSQITEKLSTITTLGPQEQDTARFDIADLTQQNNSDQAEIARLSGLLALVERDIQNYRLRLSN